MEDKDKNKKPVTPKKVGAGKTQKKPETVEHTPGSLTATKKRVVDKVDLKSTTEENASLLGRLRRAIGENTRPYGLTPPPVKKGPKTGPKTANPFAQKSKPYKNPVANPYRKEETEVVEKLEPEERLRKYRFPAYTEYKKETNETAQIFRVNRTRYRGKPPFKVVHSKNDGSENTVTYHPDFESAHNHAQKVLHPVKEEVEQTNEAVLTLAQRIKRAQIMRREAPKIERAREISRTRFAKDSQLKNRAEVLARRLVKKKFAGQRGYDYQKLSTSEKMAIDAMVDKKVALIHSLAKRLYPVVKRKEVARMLARHQGVNATPGASPVNLVNSYDPEMQIVEKKLRKVPKDATTGLPKKYVEGLPKSVQLARAAYAKTNAQKDPSDPSAYEDFPGDKEAREKGMPPSPHTKRAEKMFRESDGPVVWSKGNYSIEKIGNKFALYDGKKKTKEFSSLNQAKKTVEPLTEQIAGLKKKAEKSGIPYGTLKKVYDRGMAAWRTGHRPGTTPQQWAFARVNSYITKGKGTYYGADKDLREQTELNEWYIDTASKYKPSRGDSIVTNNGGRVFGRVERVDETSVYFRNQHDNRVYKTEINNVSKVDHWDGTLNENHMPSCPDYEEPPKKKTLLKRIKKALSETQRVADSAPELYVDPYTGLKKTRRYRRPTAVSTGEKL